MVDDLQTQLSSREQQLGVLENLILTRELNKQVYPEGRPVQEGWISSYFGQRADPFTGYSAVHKGVDFAGPEGTKVRRWRPGLVTFAGERPGYRPNGGNQPWQWLGHPLLPQREAAGEAGRHGAQGPGSGVDGLDRPFDRPASAFRSAQERRPGRSVALHRRGSAKPGRVFDRGLQARASAPVRRPAPSKRFPALPVYPYNTQFFKDSLRVWKLLTQDFRQP